MKKLLLLVAMMMLFTSKSNAQHHSFRAIYQEINAIEHEIKALPPTQQDAINVSLQRIRILLERIKQEKEYVYTPPIRTLNEEQLASLITSLKKTPFFESQYLLISNVSNNTMFYMDQIEQLLKVFMFPSERNRVRNLILPKVIDPENIYLLYNMYPFLSDQKELNEIISKRNEPFQPEN